jgi:TP901 family phage tail tape measure protein
MATSEVRLLFLGDSASAVRSVSRLESSFSGLGRAAKIVTGALAVGLVGSLAASAKAAVDFDRSMRNVNSIAKLSESQFKTLEKQVLSLGKTTGQTPKVLADGLYDIVSSGFKANAAVKILAVSAKAATAGMTDTATASKAVVAILNAYHLSADKARNVSSLLFTEVNKGVNTFEELATNIGDTAPLAAQLKVPFSDVAAGLALITLHGTSMAEASTQMSRVMADLLKPSKELQATFHKLGYENGQAAIEAHGFVPLIQQLSKEAKGSAGATSDWFHNIRSLRGMLNLTGPNLKLFNQFAAEMSKSFEKGGADVAAFNEQSKSISVQWAKAKAAIIAASIPIGQMLFPLLAKAAAKGQELGRALGTHLPEIKADFQALSGVVAELGRALGQIGRVALSPGGSSALLGGLAAVGTGNLILNVTEKIKALQAGMGALGPAGLAASIGVGLVAGAFVLIAREGDAATKAIQGVTDAYKRSKLATDDAKQANLNLQQAEITKTVTTRQARSAQELYNKAVKQFGPDSAQARDALTTLKQAQHDAAQATLDAKRATTADKAARQEHSKAIADQRTKVAGLAAAIRNQTKNQDFAAAAAGRSSAAFALANKNLDSHFVSDYAAAMSRLGAMLEGVNRTASLAAKATAALADSLGRLPTHKEVNLYIRTFQVGGSNIVTQGRVRGRAKGGFIPGRVGSPVPILAHAGEVVLNPMQQQALGGARALASMFGFRGDEGPSFASGGFVKPDKPPKRRRSGHSPHHARHPRVKPTNKAARQLLTALDAVDVREANMDRAYGQLARGFDITQEVFIRTDADGNDYISQPDITQRVSEIDQLIGARNQYLALLDQEKEELKKAIAALKKAIANMLKAIAAEKATAKNEAEAIARLNKQIAAERRKKKPNQKLIDRLDAQVSTHKTYQQRHLDQVSTLSGTVSDFRDDLRGVNANLTGTLPLDRKDVTLDIQTLQAERMDVSGTKLSPSTGGGGGVTVPGPNLDDLLRQIGQLKLALGIQGAQQGIIQSFAGGTLNVPTTGLALVHAGEQITPAGSARGGGSEPIHVHVHNHVTVEDGAVNQDKIRAVAVSASDRISQVIGERAIERARSGRF